jgi:hypothetical protein
LPAKFTPIVLAVAVSGALTMAPTFAAVLAREIPTRDGVTIKFIENSQAGASAGAGAVILMMGGNGRAYLNKWDGRGDPAGNFLVRSRGLFASAGFNAAMPGAPSDHHNKAGLRKARTGRTHAGDIGAVIANLRRKSSGKVFLVGTSRGTISAAGVSAWLPEEALAGIVFASTETRTNNKGNRYAVTDVDLEKIKVPVLLAHRKDDDCYVCVPSDLADISKRLISAPTTKILLYEGGTGWRGNHCGAFHAHGFLIFEDRVVADIVAWMKAVGRGGTPRRARSECYHR